MMIIVREKWRRALREKTCLSLLSEKIKIIPTVAHDTVWNY